MPDSETDFVQIFDGERWRTFALGCKPAEHVDDGSHGDRPIITTGLMESARQRISNYLRKVHFTTG